MLFQLPEINREKTKEAVEKALEQYRVCLLTVDERRTPKVTQTFSLVPPTNTNEFHSSTEDIAVANVDGEKRKLSFIEQVRKAVNRIRIQEREIIIRRYINEDTEFDYQIYTSVGLSERQYYRIKARAFYNLAFALKIEVIKEDLT
ncbi:ArpU family phage packaging/lysis transcriptional regulator [Bacillaceae bacterium IKA-2]|nr:ArpU family phage packaging/lysis transcriptional regulator [Bacillaceae bacterium IKA-2]